MANSFYLKQGDTADPIVAVLSDQSGPVDLTGMTVTFRMRKKYSRTTKVDADANPDPDQTENTGKVSYQFVEDDVDEVGEFIGEFHVFTGSDSATFPNGNSYIEITIGDDIDPIED